MSSILENLIILIELINIFAEITESLSLFSDSLTVSQTTEKL